MSKIKQALLTKPMTLIVSLPVNNLELAKLAWENGADFIKVHTNVFHNASKGQFGTFDEQLPFLTELLKTSPVPVGIVPAQNPGDAEKVIEKIVTMGFDFISLYGQHYPAIGCLETTSTAFAIDDLYSLEEIKTRHGFTISWKVRLFRTMNTEQGLMLDLSKLATLAKLSVPQFCLPKGRSCLRMYHTCTK